ncbi:D-amino acid aminotransferase [Frateuria sp. Soil773]|uniref:DUF4865 family protein n=1 Tax=Frateuria sp. Soil773 TaxID=1736407 RepID=UPI0006F6239D|nr:DUF4865 family protein [Frateuria sp. Soil773]KRF02011.1 D-amino acid aminotransferase [Frateuria sp. Soil773]
MIAMQYGFTLPADYDMAIIRRRIADKGHLLDDFAGLAFKAYLHAARDDRELPSRDNLYAPFYLWRDGDGMNAFLGGAGFAALARDFGRPAVRTWLPWQAELAEDLRDAASATRERIAVPAHADLGELRRTEAAAARQDRADGALAAIAAYDPARWTLLRFRLWPTLRPDLAREGRQLYRVGHVSQPIAPHR